jgi:hypothetical protein
MKEIPMEKVFCVEKFSSNSLFGIKVETNEREVSVRIRKFSMNETN